MGMFDFFKKDDDVLDLSERYKKQQERLAMEKEETEKENSSETSGSGLGFLGNLAGSAENKTESVEETENSDYADLSLGIEERRRRLTKRLLEMTKRIEDLSNQVYHLQQRIELLETKMGVSDRG